MSGTNEWERRTSVQNGSAPDEENPTHKTRQWDYNKLATKPRVPLDEDRWILEWLPMAVNFRS